MSFTNTPERYGVISAAFHWLSAIIVYGMFALGLWMVTLSYYDGWYHKAPELHKSIGILLMMGLVIRVLWRVISPPPGPLPSYSPMTRLAARAGHLALYLLLFAIGISGYRLISWRQPDGKADFSVRHAAGLYSDIFRQCAGGNLSGAFSGPLVA